MKKIIRINESQLLSLIKIIITEAEVPSLNLNDFTSLPAGNLELEENPSAIVYKAYLPQYNKKGKLLSESLLLQVNFIKKPKNDKYKIELLGNDNIGSDLINNFDDDIVNYFESKGDKDFANNQNRSSRSGDNEEYFIEYYLDINELNEFKKMISKFFIDWVSKIIEKNKN
jgi:hypothetical protein